MNKTQLIDQMAAKSGLTKADAKKALDAFIDVTSEALANDKISLIGFGTFSVSVRGERMGRNPITGQEMKIEAKKIVKFKAGRELNDKVNM